MERLNFQVTGLGRAGETDGSRVVELVTDDTIVGVEIPTLLAMDLALALLSMPKAASKVAARPVTGLSLTTTETGELVLVIALGARSIPFVLPADAAESLSRSLSAALLPGRREPRH